VHYCYNLTSPDQASSGKLGSPFPHITELNDDDMYSNIYFCSHAFIRYLVCSCICARL
jgi:hypothetical protein